MTAYALTGGADFGGGMWDLLAGRTDAGRDPRALIDRSLAPVWEANHVWLIVDLVVLWTAFPAAFAAIMSTLFVPLSLAAFGILLSGAGFALRQASRSTEGQQLNGALFAASSLLTPYFMGAAVGAIVTGHVPASGTGNRIGSWTTATSTVLGLLSVVAFAYLAAVYLTFDARRRAPGSVGYFRARTIGSGLVAGALAGAALYELHSSAPRIINRLLGGVGLPFVIVSAALGVTVLGSLWLNATRDLRPLAAGAFAAIIWGWGVSQWPQLLPGGLTVHTGAAPHATLVTEIGIIGVISAFVGPAFILLFRLAQRDMLVEGDTSADPTPEPAQGITRRTSAEASERPPQSAEGVGP